VIRPDRAAIVRRHSRSEKRSRLNGAKADRCFTEASHVMIASVVDNEVFPYLNRFK
jgi:hypothetical protein